MSDIPVDAIVAEWSRNSGSAFGMLLGEFVKLQREVRELRVPGTGGAEHLAQVIVNYQAQVASLGRYINLLEDHIKQLGSEPPVMRA